MAQRALFASAMLAACANAAISSAAYFYNESRPLVVGHRGSFGAFPEHTNAGYTNCYLGGCDFIELDLQLTKDGYLVANHDPTLLETTDISEYSNIFGGRMKSLVNISGSVYKNNYEIIDFTLAELQIFKRRQRYEFRSTLENDKYNIMSFDEIVNQVNLLNDDFPRVINSSTKVGLYIEIKNYDWYLAEHNIDMAEQLFNALKAHGLSQVADCESKIPIIIQSFYLEALAKFATLSDLPLVYLMHYSASQVWDFEAIGAIVHGLGPSSDYLFKWTPPSDFVSTSSTMSPFIQIAHAHNMAVHPYTFQDDALKYTSSAVDEVQLYISAGIDGLFNEFPHSTYNLFTAFGT